MCGLSLGPVSALRADIWVVESQIGPLPARILLHPRPTCPKTPCPLQVNSGIKAPWSGADLGDTPTSSRVQTEHSLGKICCTGMGPHQNCCRGTSSACACMHSRGLWQVANSTLSPHAPAENPDTSRKTLAPVETPKELSSSAMAHAGGAFMSEADTDDDDDDDDADSTVSELSTAPGQGQQHAGVTGSVMGIMPLHNGISLSTSTSDAASLQVSAFLVWDIMYAHHGMQPMLQSTMLVWAGLQRWLLRDALQAGGSSAQLWIMQRLAAGCPSQSAS